MIWAPFALAVVFGLTISAGIYFVAMWPSAEPPADDDDHPDRSDDADHGRPTSATTSPAGQ